jgi:hypothetical protein
MEIVTIEKASGRLMVGLYQSAAAPIPSPGAFHECGWSGERIESGV